MANIPISSFTAAANTTGIGMSGFSLTGSNAQSIIDLAATWNTSGTPTGVKLNVTDTASNAASLLMDLQVGGVTRFSVSKAGAVVARAGGYNNPAYQYGANGGYTYFTGGQFVVIDTGGTGVFTVTSSYISIGGNGDAFIFRDAANTLAQRNGVNAQTSRIYNTYTDASNYERGGFLWLSNRLVVGTSNAGTGTSRSLDLVGTDINFKIGTQESNSNRWIISNAGVFGAATDNTYDIGASGANRPRNLYMGSWLRMATTVVASLPAAATAGAGARMFVTDALAPTFGSAVTGGGAVTVPVYSTGSAWNVG